MAPVINGESTLVIDGPVPLFPLEGVTGTTATNVNDPFAGGPFQIVGFDRSGGRVRAVTWTIDLNADGTLAQPFDAVDLGSLVSNPGHTRAYGNNDLGDVCGDSGSYPMIKPFDSAMQPLQLLNNGIFGDAIDVNELAQVVGFIWVEAGDPGSLPVDNTAAFGKDSMQIQSNSNNLSAAEQGGTRLTADTGSTAMA